MITHPSLCSPNRLQALACRILGHRWQAVLPGTRASVLHVCLRCRENGWRLIK